MFKRFRTVSMMLFLLGAPAGMTFAAIPDANGVHATQQSGVCKGVVNDEFGPVIGASVVVKGTTNGVITDIDGNFSLSGVKEGAIIQISFVGYKTVEMAWKGQPLNITMKEDSEMLQEVVVTGYGGKQLRTKVTNSISKVSNEALSVGVHSNPAQALSGAVSGLRVIQSSGNPGAKPSMVLRGGTNFNGENNEPLVMVDGQIRTTGLSDINPEDIESMEVLKDAGATAIYGARASNGVVLVTTKSGKEGRMEVNLKARFGLNYVNLPHEFVDAHDYLYWMRTAYRDTPWAPKGNLTGKTPLGTGNDINDPGMQWNVMGYKPEYDYLLQKGWAKMEDPVNPGEYLIYKNTNVEDFNLNSPAFTQDYNVNFTGGNDKGTYYAGLGYNKSEGLPATSFYERYSFVFNGSYKLTKWLKSTSNFSFNRANWDSMPGSQGDEANYFGRIMSVPATARYMDEDGNPLLGPNVGDGNQTFQNEKWTEDNQSDKFTMVQKLDIDFMKNLTLSASANWYYSEMVQEAFTKDYQINQAGTQFNRGRGTSFQFERSFSQTYNAILNYNTTIKRDHSLAAMLGMEYYCLQKKGVKASGSGAPTDDFGDLELTDPGEGKRSIDSWHEESRILSYLGRVNYDYQSKYLVSAVFRYDGYSSLLDNRWGFFPGISAGWVFGKEEFIQNALPFMSFGKLRASYGINGNASGIGPYTLQGSYVPAFKNNDKVVYNGNTGFLIGTLPNPTLRWEKTRTFEVGADLSFFENRLNANLTYYNRLTSDKYADFKLPPSTGFSSITNNNGEFRNQGIEIELSGTALKLKDFTWDLRGNITFNKNKIVKLPHNGLDRNRQGGYEIYTGKQNPDGSYEKKWVGGYQEGMEPGVMIGFVNQGIFQSDEEINAAYPSGMVIAGNLQNKIQYTPAKWATLTEEERSKGVLIRPGDLKWKDINGDGMIDQYDKEVFGNTTPRWTGGLTSTMRWKGLTFYAAMDFAFGFKNYDWATAWYMSAGQGTYSMPTQVFDSWTEENRNAKYPRYQYADFLGPANWGRVSDLNVYNGAYLAFRELALSYSLPKTWISKAYLQKVELSITAQNLGYLTAAPVAQPEVSRVPDPNGNGLASGTGYPMPRTVLFGINVTF